MSYPYEHKPCPHCKRYTNRASSVDAVIIHENKILLVKRGHEPFKNYWATPGGYVDWGETLEEAVSREVFEETNLVTTNVIHLWTSSEPSRHPEQVINHAFIVNVEAKEAIAGDDATDVQWFNLDNLPKNIAFDQRESITKAIEKITIS